MKQKKTHQAVAQSQSPEKPRDYYPIQKSSSQSSSLDITGPETPSPHSEPDMSAMRVEDNRSETNVSQVEMDPHVRRLLGSLALSAAASENANEKSTKAAGDEAKSIVPSYALHSDSSDDSPLVPRERVDPGIDQYKSSFPLSSQVSQQADTSRAQSIHDHPTLASPRSHKTSSAFTVRPKPSLNGMTLIEENLPTLNYERTYPTSTLISPSTHAPRRSISTADISPYLIRTADAHAPISATRLKQLSLLETVADESARMSSAIAARAAMTSANPVASGYPLPPLSVPPQSMMGNVRDPGVIYSSDHPRGSSYAPGFQPAYNPLENNFYGEPDPFQVRSRTSQSFHRTLTHKPTGSINIHQDHLLAAMNGSLTPSMNSSQYGSQFIQQHQPPQLHHTGPPVSVRAWHIPPPQVIHGFSPAPQPLPAGCAPTNRGLQPTTVNPPYNSSLLSILNTRPGQLPTVTAQHNQ